MGITLVGLPDDYAIFQYGNDINTSGVSVHPPMEELIDNHGNVSGDYLDFGCFDYFDSSVSSGMDAGYDSWSGGTTYFHTEFGTLWNMDEWEIDGGDVTTQGLSFDYTDKGIQVHVDYTRAFSNLDGSETWVAQYSYAGQSAGTVITTFDETGMDVYGINAQGDTVFHKNYQP